jgi:hypothetical protein
MGDDPDTPRSATATARPTANSARPGSGEQAARFIDRVAAAASQVADDRAWERVLVSAGEQLTDRLVGGQRMRTSIIG